MAGRKRPSFLKKQKEQKRLAKALRKREDRQARRHQQAAPEVDADADTETLENVEPAVPETGPEGEEPPVTP